VAYSCRIVVNGH